MKKTGYFAILSSFGIVLSGCSASSILKLFKKAAKQTADLIVVSDEKKASLIKATNNFYEVDFELESHNPFSESETEVLDIANTKQEDYVSSFKTAMTTYEQKNDHAKITQETYFSSKDEFTKYGKGQDLYEVKKVDGGYEVKRNDETVDLSQSDKKDEIDKAYTLAKSQLDYCYSFELNSLLNIKARLQGSTADESSTINFLTNVSFKEYKDAGNYVAMYLGEAHKNSDSKDVKIDYIEMRYVDYRIQYSLIHSVSTEYGSLVEVHKLSYSKFLYNVSLENCFK